MMLQNGEAYSSMPWVIVAASLLPTEYWFLGRKPDLAGLFYGKAFSHSKNDFNTEGNSFGPLLNKTQSSHVSVQVSLGACVSLESNLFREELSCDVGTRSWRVPRKCRNRKPNPNYKKGDVAWLTIVGMLGAFKVTVDTDGDWDADEQQWKYAVRQTDGKLYEEGKLVGEEDLNRNEK